MASTKEEATTGKQGGDPGDTGKSSPSPITKQLAKVAELKKRLEEEERKARLIQDAERKRAADARKAQRKVYDKKAGKIVGDMFHPMPLEELSALLSKIKPQKGSEE